MVERIKMIIPININSSIQIFAMQKSCKIVYRREEMEIFFKRNLDIGSRCILCAMQMPMNVFFECQRQQICFMIDQSNYCILFVYIN